MPLIKMDAAKPAMSPTTPPPNAINVASLPKPASKRKSMILCTFLSFFSCSPSGTMYSMTLMLENAQRSKWDRFKPPEIKREDE